MSSWVKIRFQHLKLWRKYAAMIAKAARDVVPGAKVYVVGGVAEGRVTVLSDIDVLVVVPRGKLRKGLYAEIMMRAMDAYGLPLDAPVELHIVEEGGESRYKTRIEIKAY